MSGKFPMGFWNYQPAGKYGPEEVKRWADCGMTLTLSPTFTYGQSDKAAFLALLDACAAQGVRLIVCIPSLNFSGDADAETYRRDFKKAYDDFGRHPAVFGFFIGDEPSGEKQMAACVRAYHIQLEVAPELTPFLNFNPYWPNIEKEALGGRTFSAWAKEFAAATSCRLICYDHYSQMNPGEEGIDAYFLSMKKYGDAAKAANLPLWTTLLSVGHFRYRVPDEDDLRWQLGSAVACGCRGILWFFFYNGMPCNNYRGSPIDEFGGKTETYTRLSLVLRRFHAMYGDLLTTLKFREAFHVVKSYGGFPLFPENSHPLIRRVESVHGVPGIVSFYEDGRGTEYAVLANNSPFESGQFRFVLPKDKTRRIIRTGLNGKSMEDFRVSHHDAHYAETADAISAGAWLAPGQIEIFIIA